MRKTTKDDIFWMLVFILSAATSALVLWGLARFFGNTEVDEIAGMFPAFMVVTAVAFVPWAYLLDFVFRLFEKKST